NPAEEAERHMEGRRVGGPQRRVGGERLSLPGAELLPHPIRELESDEQARSGAPQSLLRHPRTVGAGAARRARGLRQGRGAFVPIRYTGSASPRGGRRVVCSATPPDRSRISARPPGSTASRAPLDPPGASKKSQ